MVWTFGAPLRRQEMPAPVACEVRALFSRSFRCYCVAACLRPARPAFGLRVQASAMFQHRRGLMPIIGSHGALSCDAVCLVPTRAVRLQLAPQVEGTPAFLGDAADEFVHEGQFGEKFDIRRRRISVHGYTSLRCKRDSFLWEMRQP
jgi:hypothetical protein